MVLPKLGLPVGVVRPATTNSPRTFGIRAVGSAGGRGEADAVASRERDFNGRRREGSAIVDDLRRHQQDQGPSLPFVTIEAPA